MLLCVGLSHKILINYTEICGCNVAKRDYKVIKISEVQAHFPHYSFDYIFSLQCIWKVLHYKLFFPLDNYTYKYCIIPMCKTCFRGFCQLKIENQKNKINHIYLNLMQPGTRLWQNVEKNEAVWILTRCTVDYFEDVSKV